MRSLGCALALLLAGPAYAGDWSPFADASVVRIVTRDEGGAERDTKVWFVVLGGDAFVRTNDSRWLANIRRGSGVLLRLDGKGRSGAPDPGARPARSGRTERAVTAEEVSDPALGAAVEEAFKAKYGFVQRVMSAFRMREPTVLRLREKAS